MLGGEFRRRDVFSMLVLHLIHGAEDHASYGNQLIQQIEDLTRGAIVLNPNTIYPLLRELEQRGLIEGSGSTPRSAAAASTPCPAGTARVPRPAQGPGAVPGLDHRQHQPHQAGRLRAAAAARRNRKQGEKGIGLHGLFEGAAAKPADRARPSMRTKEL